MAKRWRNNRNTLFSWALKSLQMVTAAMKLRHLLLGRKAITNLDSVLKILKIWAITLMAKVRLAKAMVFPIVTCGCERWTIKKAECQRIDAFELWCWRRLLRVPRTARRSNKSILKKINPEYSLEGLMLKLKLQYLGHLMWRADSLEKTLMLRKAEGRTRRGQQRTRWLDAVTNAQWIWASSGRWWRTGRPGMLQSMGLQRIRHNWATEQQQLPGMLPDLAEALGSEWMINSPTATAFLRRFWHPGWERNATRKPWVLMSTKLSCPHSTSKPTAGLLSIRLFKFSFWKISKTNKTREKNLMYLQVSATQLQQSSKHGQSCFILCLSTRLPWICCSKSQTPHLYTYISFMSKNKDWKTFTQYHYHT